MGRRKPVRNPRSRKMNPPRIFDLVEDENTNDVYLEVKNKEYGTENILLKDLMKQVETFIDSSE